MNSIEIIVPVEDGKTGEKTNARCSIDINKIQAFYENKETNEINIQIENGAIFPTKSLNYDKLKNIIVENQTFSNTNICVICGSQNLTTDITKQTCNKCKNSFILKRWDK